MQIGDTINLSSNASITRTLEGFINETGSLIVRTEGATTPTIEEGLFTVRAHEIITEFVRSEAFIVENDDNVYNRVRAHNLPYFKHIHKQLEDVASEIFGEPVKASYNYLSLYNENGVCPFHIDKPQCKYTIDYCIDQDQTWDIWVDDKNYTLKPNDALCYSGTDSPHFREKIKGKYCWLVFFHFVPIDFNENLN